ncbi:unnamed protein product [Orchesella dallaii]|uniref:C2H2-type domain-containing protein n=1 Tax=Orchesella dallaii TaxID=48710 RepID=A0ABP1RJ53_9HEXA
MNVPGKLFFVKDGRIHYEDKDQHKKRVELRDKILKTCQSCKCGKQFVSEHGFLEHLKNSKKEGCEAIVVKLQNQIEYGRADTVASNNQDNECNKRKEDDIGRIPYSHRC